MDGYEEYGRGYRAHTYSQQIHYDGLHDHVEEDPELQWDYSNHFDDPMWGDNQPLHEGFTNDRHLPNTQQGDPQHNTIIDLLSQLLDQQKETDERLDRIVEHQKMTENQLAQIASEGEAKENSKEAIGNQSTQCSRKSEQLGKPSPSPNAELIEDVKGITLKSGKILPPPLEKSDLETPRRETEGSSNEASLESLEDRCLERSPVVLDQAPKEGSDKEDSSAVDYILSFFSTSPTNDEPISHLGESLEDQHEVPKGLVFHDDLIANACEELSREPPSQQEFISLDESVESWTPKRQNEDVNNWLSAKDWSRVEDPYLFTLPPEKFLSFRPYMDISIERNSYDPSIPNESNLPKGSKSSSDVHSKLGGRKRKWDIKIS